MKQATVIIPTLCRPQQLSEALTSLIQMRCSDKVERVIVVDNDPNASAKETVKALGACAPFKIIWAHEPRPGIAHARNTGVAYASDANLIAFLDDDERASSDWLSHLIETQNQTGADVVFGPIAGKAPTAEGKLRPFIEDFFSRHGPAENRVIEDCYGCGNSLLKRTTTMIGPAPFDLSSNETGGEDDILFTSLKQQGRVFAWSANAWVDEVTPANRAKLAYVLQRAFAYGQGPTQTAIRNRQWHRALTWVAIGAVQTCWFGLASFVTCAITKDRHSYMLRRCVEGLGKVFWFSAFEPKFYGQSELDRVTRV